MRKGLYDGLLELLVQGAGFLPELGTRSFFPRSLSAHFLSMDHEQTAQNLILSVHSLLFALFLTERHRSQNASSLKSEERLSDFKERCAQLCFLRQTCNGMLLL